MKAWFSAGELAGMPGLPATKAGVILRATRESWTSRPRAGRGGGREYALEALPAATRAHLAVRIVSAIRHADDSVTLGAAPPPAPIEIAPTNANAPLAGLSGRAKTRAEARLAILAAFDSFRRAGCLTLRTAEHQFAAAYNRGAVAVEPWVLAGVKHVSAGSLWNWRRQFSTAGAGRLGGAYKGRRERGKIDGNPALRDLIVAQIAHQPHLCAAQVLDNLRARVGDATALPGLRRLQAWMARWRHENKTLFAAIADPDAARSRFRLAFGSASEQVARVNQLWEIDDTKADVMTADGRRTLILAVDVATRRMKVLVSETPKAVAAAALIRRCLLDWGTSSNHTLKSDNGANYTARHFKRGLAALGIHHTLCDPFSPWQKPHVERGFRTLSHDLLERLPGYVGHDVAERQAIRARTGFAQRLGESDAVLFEISMSASDLQRAIDVWCEAKYAHAPHDGLDGRTPAEIAAAQESFVRRLADPRALDVLLAEAPGDGWRVVGKKGIALDNTFFIAAALAPLAGERVMVRYDATDMGRIHVYGEDGAFVCVAEAPERTGIDRQEVAAKAHALKRRIDVEGRARIAQLKRQVRPERMVIESLAKAAATRGAVVEFPPGDFTTPALDAAGDAMRALAAPASTWEPPVISDVGAGLRPAPTPEDDTQRRSSATAEDQAGRPRPPAAAPDLIWALWVLANPAEATEAEREEIAELRRRKTFEQCLQLRLHELAEAEAQRKTAAS